MPAAESKTELRRQLRERRRSLDVAERRLAARAVAAQLAQTSFFRLSRRIACYLPADGEIDTALIVDRIHRLQKKYFLPVLSRIGHDRLWFAHTERDAQFRPNRYGIAEPLVPTRDLVRAQALDLILLPLVGFDADGGRLGMGGGYYDRSLAFLLARTTWRRPRLVGLAYECQKVSRLPREAWDVPLNAVVTERAVYDVTS